METQTLDAELRESKGTSASMRMRGEGLVPAVLYGHGAANVLLAVNRHSLDQVLHHGVRVLDLVIGKKKETAVIREVQYDSMGDNPLHVDFARVSADEKLRVEIPIVLVGAAPGAASGGILDHPVTDVEIECLATQVPESIKVSIRSLEIGDSITVGELEAPEGVTVLTNPGLLVATVHPPVKPVEEAEEEEGEAEAAPAEPEVIGAEESTEDETDEKSD